MNKEYSVDLQKLFLEIMITDAQSFVRVQNIYNPQNFDRSLRDCAKFLQTHADQYKTLPTIDQIRAVAGIDLKTIPDISENHLEWFMNEFESFTKRQELERAILSAADLLEKGEFGPVEKLIKDADQYKTLPTIDQIRAVAGVDLKTVPDISENHLEWFMNEFESFTKRQELERAILSAADLLEKGEFGPVEKLIKDAVQISLQKDMGTDYWASPSERLNKYFNAGGQVSTGWPQMDRLLYGGFSRGELNIFAGGSGSGKSLVMMNIALNWLQQGLSGVYITLELAEELTSLRTDAMLTGMSTKDIRRDIETTELKVKVVAKKSGDYQVKYMPAQSNINDIRAYLKEYQIQTGKRVDFLMIDYLDLLMPVSAKVSPSDLFVKDKYVSEELRNLAKELGVLMVTASQLNRSAVEEVEFDHSHISGGISKINTADNVFGIFTSRAMRERGKYQIQCMKSRSSTGVGQKIDLDYNMENMRITDPGESQSEESGYRSTATNILNNIKTSTTVNKETGEITPAPAKNTVVESTKLKQMLSSFKSTQL